MQINFSGGGSAESGSIAVIVGAMVRVRLSALSQCMLVAKITSASGDTSSITINNGELFELPVAAGDSVQLAYDGQGHDKAICTGFLESVYDVSAAPTMRRTLAANTAIDMLAYGAVEFQCAGVCTVTQSHDGTNFLACPVADATSTSPSLVASASGAGIWSVSGGRWLKFSADVTLVGSN